MPIRNLTENPRLPRLGKIRLGIKVDGPKGQYPKSVDYFVCPPEIQEVYGEKPKALEIAFASDDQEACASQWYRAYKQTTGLVCKGDGYRADALLDTDKLKQADGQITAAVWAGSTSKHVIRQGIDCLGEGFEGNPPCPLYAAGGCKRLMMLQFVISRVGGIGVWQLDTSSINSIQNVNGFLRMLKLLTGGRLQNIELTLRLIPLAVAPDGHKKTVHVLELHTDKTMRELLEAGTQPVAHLLLPPPDDELPEDFFPQEAEAQSPTAPIEGENIPELNGAGVSIEGEIVQEVAPESEAKPEDTTKTITPDQLFGFLRSYELEVADLAAYFGCKATDVYQAAIAWGKAEPGRTLRMLVDNMKEAKPKHSSPPDEA